MCRNLKHVENLEFQAMSQVPRLTREQRRVKIFTLKEEGFSLAEIITKSGADRRTVQRVCNNVRETGSFKDKPRSGRPPLLNERNKRTVANILRRGEASNAQAVSKVARVHHNIDVGRKTIARALNSFGYVARVKVK